MFMGAAMIFQYQKGAIKTTSGSVEDPLLDHFNTKKVRLKLSSTCSEGFLRALISIPKRCD